MKPTLAADTAAGVSIFAALAAHFTPSNVAAVVAIISGLYGLYDRFDRRRRDLAEPAE